MHPGMEEEEGDPLAMEREELDGLMEFARKGMGRDMRARFGKPMPDEEPLEGGAPEDVSDAEAAAEEPIPGVEGESGEATEGGAELDPETLKRVLAQLVAKGG